MTMLSLAKKAVALALTSIVFTLSVWVLVISGSVGTLHDQGGIGGTIIYFPATWLVCFICALPSKELARRKSELVPEVDASRVKMICKLVPGLVAFGYILSVLTLFIS
ncbi:MAG: hypothetical protein RIQ79_300 [Verrucomicrobiota bacterium]|jgi:hypothetical protein